jgi:signal transduction histidine kinase
MLQQLQDAYLRIQTALDAQRRFVADASHELRTPLTTIRSNADLIWRRSDIAPQDHQEAVHDIVEESERMSRLVQRLLVLARADAGQHLELNPVDLSGISRDVVRQAQAVYPNRRLELVNGSLVEATGNADALKQLLWILIDNAAKYTSDGGRIGVHLTQPDSRSIRLAVEDDGTGIPAEHLGHIFERFYRADGARSGDGAGLGLAIAQWIVREHGGTVAAGNNPDGGASFTVSLPAS